MNCEKPDGSGFAPPGSVILCVCVTERDLGERQREGWVSVGLDMGPEQVLRLSPCTIILPMTFAGFHRTQGLSWWSLRPLHPAQPLPLYCALKLLCFGDSPVSAQA